MVSAVSPLTESTDSMVLEITTDRVIMTHTVGQYQPILQDIWLLVMLVALENNLGFRRNLSDKEFAAKLKTKSQATGLQSISQ